MMLSPWELLFVPANNDLVHFGICYLHRKGFIMPVDDQNNVFGDELVHNGEHELQIGILFGRIIIRYSYYPA